MSPIPALVEPGEALSPAELARYSRHLTLPGVGAHGQRRIRRAKVLVIGAGGLGSPIINYLVAAGIGQLSIIDDDLVEASNLQRQVIHRHADIGRPKAESARDAALRLDPTLPVTAITAKLTSSNALELFAAHDLVLDGTDNFATRYLANDAAELSGTPLIWGTIFRFSGQVSVFAPGYGPMLRDLFPDIPEADSVPSCAEGGVFGTLCASVGATMAGEALKLICGIGTPLIGRFWRFDALEARTDILHFTADPTREPVRELPAEGDSDPSPTSVPEVEAGALEEHALLIDVRQGWERELGAVTGSRPIELERLLDHGWEALAEISSQAGVDNPRWVFVCKTGARSARVVRVLLAQRPEASVASLRGGTVAWYDQVLGQRLVY